jgi:hypothetical protein
MLFLSQKQRVQMAEIQGFARVKIEFLETFCRFRLQVTTPSFL